MLILSCWTILFYIFYNVQRIDSVRLFNNRQQSAITLFTRFVPKVKSKTCMLKPDTGPCRSKIRMYHFDPSTNNCTRFDWGGCQGNGNRYDTFDECWNACMSRPGSKPIPKYCSLTFDYGFCFGAVQRWYYDKLWKVCKSTIYSGCGGNKNNFYNLEECEQICRFGKAPMATSRPSQSGGAKKVLIINPWNKSPPRGRGQIARSGANLNMNIEDVGNGNNNNNTALVS